jgi:uncharacterized protein
MSSPSFCRRTILSAGILWFAGSLALHAVTSLSAAGNSPAELERPEHSKESVAWQVIKLQIPTRNGLVPLRAELADTESKRERGLMFRRSLSENSGMLFVFDPPAQAAFWMKNTPIPLSIAFLDNQGRILEIRSMKPLDETVIWSASNAVAYALEVNEGWFDHHEIQTGTKVYGIPSSPSRKWLNMRKKYLLERIKTIKYCSDLEHLWSASPGSEIEDLLLGFPQLGRTTS